MTDQIVIFAMKQSTWGQRRPMQWVPLELQLTNMRMRKLNILTKDDISKVNELNEDLALNESQLEDFLNVQHSLGKLIYYPLPLLDNFVIIYPPALVNILRSFVTCSQFFPEKENLKSILQNLTAAVLNVVEDNELRVWVDNNQILVQMTNAKSLQNMSKDVAASIQECLTWNLESCIEFYSSSFGRKIKLTDVSKLYSLESQDKCEAGCTDYMNMKLMSNHLRMICFILIDFVVFVAQMKYLLGLSKDELETEPNEKHLVRLGSTFGIEKFKDYYSKLGMDATTFENIEYDFKMHGSQGIISVALIRWKTSHQLANKTPTMNDLFNALGDSDATHRMCKVRILLGEEFARLTKVNYDLNFEITPCIVTIVLTKLHVHSCE
ncbi:unnamed protein product [Mytilus edulis]|uniref:Death domain-containing protein n=1 Tax=Mytilus edulis TaxID=6550 RepID=A0A8S3SHP7_MYTED|nr:unnamed protein product [Mytilus edulis]